MFVCNGFAVEVYIVVFVLGLIGLSWPTVFVPWRRYHSYIANILMCVNKKSDADLCVLSVYIVIYTKVNIRLSL